GNVFPEDDEVALDVAGDEFAVRADEEGGVIVLVFIGGRGRRGAAHVVGTEDEPHAMLADKVGDGGIEVRIPAGVTGHGGFGPDEQVGPVGQGLFGEAYKLAEPFHVPAGVPYQRLGNAGLNEGNVQGAVGDGFPRQLPVAEVEDETDDEGGENDL